MNIRTKEKDKLRLPSQKVIGIQDINVITPGRRQSKKLILQTNVDQKLFEAELSIAICHRTGDKWQSKTLFLAIFDSCSSIVKSVFDCRLPGVVMLCTS